MKPWSEKWNALCDEAIDFTPNPLQQEITDWWTTSDARVMQILGGERSGKSLNAAALGMRAMRPAEVDKGESLYWIVGPDYYQCRPEFSYLLRWLDRVDLLDGPASMPQNLASSWSLRTKLNQHIVTRTSLDITKLASFTVAGSWMAEAAQQPNEVYLKLLGRISETRGFLMLVGSLEKGLPWYEDLYRRWQGPNVLEARSFSLPTWSNTDIYPGGRDDPAIKELEAETPSSLFMERYGAVPSTPHGVVVPEFDFATHVRHLEVVEGEPVYLLIDPGKHTYAVLFVQHIGLYTHVLDRVYVHGQIVHEVIPQVMGNPLFKHINKREAGVIDFAGRQEQANKSQITLWKEMADCSLASRYIPLERTIGVLRFRMGEKNVHHEPLVYFNDHMTNAKTPDGRALDVLAEFELWRWPDRSWQKNEARRPVDKSNDALKALAYGLVHRYGDEQERPKAAPALKTPYWMTAA